MPQLNFPELRFHRPVKYPEKLGDEIGLLACTGSHPRPNRNLWVKSRLCTVVFLNSQIILIYT